MLAGVSIEAFKEFLKILYSLVFSKGKDFAVKAENWSDILSLCKKYEIEDAVSSITSFNWQEGWVKLECLKEENDTKEGIDTDGKFKEERDTKEGIETDAKFKEESDTKEGIETDGKFKEESDTKEKIETNTDCILCRKCGHFISEECISSAICFGCDRKEHISRHCKTEQGALKIDECEEIKKEYAEREDYVEMEIEEDCAKSEVMLKYVNVVTNVGVEERFGTDALKVKTLQASKISKDFNEFVKQEVDIKEENIENCAENENQYIKTESINKDTLYLGKERLQVKKSDIAEEKLIITSKQRYDIHVGGVHGEAKYQCSQCEYKTVIKSNLDVHVKSVHGEAKYQCSQCEYRTPLKANLMRHVEGVHGEAKYQCSQCEYRTTLKDSLMTHVKGVHGEAKYQCSQCEYKTTMEGRFNIHVKSVHGEAKYQCSQCEYRTPLKANLMGHVKFVHGEAKYQCSQCEYKTTRKSRLDSHVKIVHDEVMYKCSQCDYKTKNKTLLKNHVELKHDNVLHACPRCRYKHPVKSKLRKHFKKHH